MTSAWPRRSFRLYAVIRANERICYYRSATNGETTISDHDIWRAGDGPKEPLDISRRSRKRPHVLAARIPQVVLHFSGLRSSSSGLMIWSFVLVVVCPRCRFMPLLPSLPLHLPSTPHPITPPLPALLHHSLSLSSSPSFSSMFARSLTLSRSLSSARSLVANRSAWHRPVAQNLPLAFPSRPY